MNEFKKSEFDKRLEGVSDLVSGYFAEIGPLSRTECVAIIQALMSIWETHAIAGYVTQMNEKEKNEF